MKRLVVLRHGTAESPAHGKSDFDRQLVEIGKQNAARVGQVLIDRVLMPDVIITSSAARAKTTANIVATSCQFQNAVIEHAQLYSASVAEILDVLRTGVSESAATALIVGHNPGFEYVLELFGSEFVSLPPAGWGAVDLDVEAWSDVDRSTTGVLTEFWTPQTAS